MEESEPECKRPIPEIRDYMRQVDISMFFESPYCFMQERREEASLVVEQAELTFTVGFGISWAIVDLVGYGPGVAR